MGSFSVAGGELKAMVKAAKKQPVGFGFSPANDDAASYCGMHRTKSPAVIGKEAKDEGEGKYTFGTASVSGKLMTLTVERDLPQLAKKFKRFLKANRVMLNVQILDTDGKVIDSDIEEGLPDDPELDDDDAAVTSTSEAAPPDGEAEAPVPDAAALMKRLAALRERIGALPPDLATRFGGPFKTTVDLARAGKLGEAVAAADRIEAALTAAGAQGAPAQPVADDGLGKLRQAVALLRSRAEGLTDAKARGAITAALDAADGHLNASDGPAAMELIRKVQTLLAQLAPAEGGEDAAAAWEKRRAALEPLVVRGLSQGLVADVDGLRKVWDFAVASAADGAPDKALALVPRIEALLAATREAGFAAEVAPDARPFAQARVIWADARSTMFTEIRKLEADILAAMAGDEAEADVKAALPLLSGQVERLDARLEDAMDAIVNTQAGPERERLKGAARDLIAEYRGVLGDEFFADVDGESGFGSYAVAATATDALRRIEASIA